MDHVIISSNKELIRLEDIFLKEECFYNKEKRFFSDKIWTASFFKRINNLEKVLLNQDQKIDILSEKKDIILNFINQFKEEHHEKVMKKNIYSNYLQFFKYEDEKYGFCGWIPKFNNFYKISLKNKSYEEKLFYCHLTEDEKKFKFQPKIKKN